MTHARTRHVLTTSTLLALSATLAACGSSTTASPGSATTSTTTEGSDRTEVRELHPRAVLAHDGGLTTIDTVTGDVVATTEKEGFLRLNPVGDGQHVMVTDGDAFRVFDAGVTAEAHGDHAHLYTSTPRLMDVSYDAPKAGHVVPHEGWTTLFADGTGEITSVRTADVASPDARREEARTETAHHGVAIRLEDGSLLMTQGDEDERSTVQRVVDGRVEAETTDCAGVHGEATAAEDEDGEVAVFGCEDGPVVFRAGDFHKVPVKDTYARTGNLAGSPGSSIVLGDYKVDPDAEPERTTRVSLIDTETATMRLVDLGSPYWFRSLARGPHGEGVVLTGDGKLNVIDVETGTVADRIPVIGEWEENKDWQQPGPVLKVVGDHAYVTDPAAQELVVVDLESQETRRIGLDVAPSEMVVVTGHADGAEPHDHDH